MRDVSLILEDAALVFENARAEVAQAIVDVRNAYTFSPGLHGELTLAAEAATDGDFAGMFGILEDVEGKLG